ncbi:hypothetical protein GCM10023148_12040 [Actinokineospora soli]
MRTYTDDELRGFADQAGTALIDLAVRTCPGWDGGPEQIKSFVHDQATRCMTLDPPKIVAELDRVREIVKRLDLDRGNLVRRSTEEIGIALGRWQGSAAEAFRQRLRDIEAFGTVQFDRSLAYAKGLAALACLAANVRDDYRRVVERTMTAAAEALGEARETGGKLLVKVGASVAKAAFGGFQVDDLASAATDIGVEGASVIIEGNGFETVLTGYRLAVDTLISELYEGFAQIDADLRFCTAGVDDTLQALTSPLPPSTDVTSPEFSYEAFSIPSRPVAEFGDDVAAEKAAPRTDGAAEKSPISLRLSGNAG